MKQYEYKTLEQPLKCGIFKQQIPDLEPVLNAEGSTGWRLQQVVVTASSNFGQSDKLLLILEREK